MCGRASLSAEQCLELIRIFGETLAARIASRWNIAPTQSAYVLRHSAGGPEPVEMKWGIALPGRPLLINARGETVDKKFKAAFSQRRCIMPVSGFYEWRKQGKARQPHHITVKAQKVFGLAAIWEPPLLTGQTDNTFAVITTEANQLIRPLHDRMPVIISPSDWDAWLGLTTPLDDVRLLIRPYPAEQMELHPVSQFVNSAANEGDRCHAPAEIEPTLFD